MRLSAIAAPYSVYHWHKTMIPDPFNSVADLVLWSGFQQGASSGQDSVLEGSFAYGQFETALKQARREIYRRTLQKANDEFEDDRKDELKEAELWLAAARLYPNFASRMQLEFPESNIQSTGEVMNGSDSPSPYEKGKQLMELMQAKLRQIGLELLRGFPWGMKRFEIAIDDTAFPFEVHYPDY